jgi:hypothetical protein
MGVPRRDVLKTVAASILAGATSGGVACADEARVGNTFPSARAVYAAMNSRLLMTVRIATAASQKLGRVPYGNRTVVPVTGGNFEGQRLRGEILFGGGDWLLLRSDNVLELDLRITLETDDHARIYMTFQGLRHGAPEVIAALGRGEAVDRASYYFRTFPRFETSTESYAFLNRMVTVGVGEARPDGAIHKIYEIL